MQSSAGLKIAILQQIGKAAAKGDEIVVQSLSELLRKVRTFEKNLEASLTQVSAELKQLTLGKHSQHASQQLIVTSPSKEARQELPFKKQKLSPKKKAQFVRSRWIEARKNDGLKLMNLKGPIYKTPSGLTIGVPYASERPSRPGKFFLGLPDESMDGVVLLCETLTGTIVDPVIPKSFLQQVWNQLTRSMGQIKFNVRIGDVGSELHIPGKGWLSIAEFESNYYPLL